MHVGKTELRYHLRSIEDLHAMLKKHGDWMLLGSADEQKPGAEGTVEAWGRSDKNPVKVCDATTRVRSVVQPRIDPAAVDAHVDHDRATAGALIQRAAQRARQLIVAGDRLAVRPE